MVFPALHHVTAISLTDVVCHPFKVIRPSCKRTGYFSLFLPEKVHSPSVTVQVSPAVFFQNPFKDCARTGAVAFAAAISDGLAGFALALLLTLAAAEPFAIGSDLAVPLLLAPSGGFSPAAPFWTWSRNRLTCSAYSGLSPIIRTAVTRASSP